MRNTLPVSSLTRTSRTGSCKRVAPPAALARRQMADAVGEDRAVPANRQFRDHRQRGIGFEPGDDAALRGVELGPPRIIVIAEIKDIGSAGLDRHRLSGGDVVDPGRGDRRIDRPVGVGIVDDVQLGAAHALGKARPIAAARVEPQTARIDQIGGLGEAPAQPAMGPADHQRQAARRRRRLAGRGWRRPGSRAAAASPPDDRAAPAGSGSRRRSRASSQHPANCPYSRATIWLLVVNRRARASARCTPTSRSNSSHGTCFSN